MAKLLYTGKVKEMWSTDDPEVLRVVYTDQATAGNGEKKDDFKNKAYLNNEISTLIFEYLSKNGVPTHFIKKISDTEELVKKCDMFPLEVVTRNIAAGHFSSRYGLGEGEKFDTPVEELFYKSDELDDPIMNESDAIALHVATKETGCVITSSSLFTPANNKDMCNAEVPFTAATANFAPVYSATACSNFPTYSPTLDTKLLSIASIKYFRSFPMKRGS